MKEVVRKEVIKWLDVGIIYPISDGKEPNNATRKDHYPIPFMDQMLNKLTSQDYFCFLDGYFEYNQIAIVPKDQEKTTFTCPFGTYAFRRMPFGLCNAPATFRRCMMAIFSKMVDDFVEKCHFFIKEGIVLGHKVSKSGLEVDKETINVIFNLLHPVTIKGV
ncbi:unnamed protein product [Withania somnifera]